MYIYKINRKKLFLWSLFLIQILLIALYYYVQKDETEESTHSNRRISFLQSLHQQKAKNQTYHVDGNVIILQKNDVRNEFFNFNSSICFVNGTDIKSMDRSRNSWACNCKTGWHGRECGQPEVVWRALLTYRKKLNLKGPRTYARRILYIFQIDEFQENLLDVRINELFEVVDLFILLENNGDRIGRLLSNGFLKKNQDKILYFKSLAVKDLWHKILKSVPNLEKDDVILLTKSFEIPNRSALSFLKYYDNWPEPILFRLRWSVFGFFWRHPNKTRTEGIACSVKYMKKAFNSNFENLYFSKSSSGLILGDLNHFGGWYCEYCLEPLQIIKLASQASDIKLVNWKKLNKLNIDTNYIEDLIGNGLYIDGKTELERSRKYMDNYFAPNYVLNNSMKFDYLLINLYTKLDYYEG